MRFGTIAFHQVRALTRLRRSSRHRPFAGSRAGTSRLAVVITLEQPCAATTQDNHIPTIAAIKSWGFRSASLFVGSDGGRVEGHAGLQAIQNHQHCASIP